MPKKRKYDESSIQVLETDRDIVREKTTMFIPSRDKHGAMHVIFEVVDNSIDELMVRDSVGSDISTTFDIATKEVTVTDNGSGIPQGRLYELCTRLYASGKYNNSENSAYEYTAGVNGCGNRLITYLSEYAEFTSMQKGKKLTYRFENGFKVGEKEEKCKDHGTIVKFKLDNNLVRINDLDVDELISRYEEKSFISPKLNMTLTILNKGKTKKKYNFTGKTIVNRVEMMDPDTEILYGNDSTKVSVLENINDDNLTEVKVPVEFAIAFSEKAVDEEDPNKYMISYGNSVKTYTGGAHVEGVRNAVVKFFRDELQPNLGKRDKDIEFIPSDMYKGLCGFIIAKTHKPEFKGQYKDQLMNPEVKRAVRDIVYEALCNSKPSFQKKMSEFIVRVARGRLESKKSRTKGKDVSNSFSKDRIKKYWPIIRTANTFNPELILVEGDSAADVANTARDPENQAIYPIQKPKNIFDADSDVESAIVGVFNNIMAICNLQPGKHCDPSKSEMSRILCMTDGDVDGDRIAVSAIALLAKHCRPIIDAGMVGRIVSPAYSFKEGKKKIFVRDQRDFYKTVAKDFVKKFTLELKGKKYSNAEFGEFISNNFEYNTRLGLLADRYTCDPKMMEYLASKYHGSLASQTQQYWSRAMKMYPDITVTKEEGYILIDGTIGMETYHIAIDDYFHKHVTKFKAFQDTNKDIYGYKLNGKDCSVYEIMHTFQKHMPDGIKRYKGLGELDPDEMRKLCLDREHRTVVIFKFKDFEDDMYKLDVVMSSHAAYRRARKEIMANKKLDVLDLDT